MTLFASIALSTLLAVTYFFFAYYLFVSVFRNCLIEISGGDREEESDVSGTEGERLELLRGMKRSLIAFVLSLASAIAFGLELYYIAEPESLTFPSIIAVSVSAVIFLSVVSFVVIRQFGENFHGYTSLFKLPLIMIGPIFVGLGIGLQLQSIITAEPIIPSLGMILSGVLVGSLVGIGFLALFLFAAYYHCDFCHRISPLSCCISPHRSCMMIIESRGEKSKLLGGEIRPTPAAPTLQELEWFLQMKEVFVFGMFLRQPLKVVRVQPNIITKNNYHYDTHQIVSNADDENHHEKDSQSTRLNNGLTTRLLTEGKNNNHDNQENNNHEHNYQQQHDYHQLVMYEGCVSESPLRTAFYKSELFDKRCLRLIFEFLGPRPSSNAVGRYLAL